MEATTMDATTAEILCKLNTAFYRGQAASFSQTRQSPWPGWERCVRWMPRACDADSASCDIDSCDGAASVPRNGAVSVLDVACGNLRFETYLQRAFPARAFSFYAVDNCDELASDVSGAAFQRLDVCAALRSDVPLAPLIDAPACDMAVSFGFLHHVPGFEARCALLGALVECVRPGGTVCVSLWRFMDDARLADKARASHERALQDEGLPIGRLELDERDYLLGWQNRPGVYRYCHHFDEREIDSLAASVASSAELVDRFSADGKTGRLNTYLVFRRR